ncbi:response regulator [Bradyrhizobium sp. SRL28]|uniref:response regulator n=1 Tax=Bradyrhizobium sp. SRL28 TaxID=2836178 RepID=UPI001BDE85AE|nr:response regulator [Bradyrhizobium sp. SRL28]MBT1510281.1 response regulator [Bradyrhizobium sp. SRL28]
MAASIWTSGKEICGLVGISGPLEQPTTSSERGGSAFPLRAAEMTAMKATSSPHTPPTSGSSELKGARILLVEDSWHVGTAIKRLLRSLGADVAGPAATMADAERLISEREPDVAIVDINLRDGERANPLLDRLQEQGIPVIVITGYTSVSLPPGKVEAILQKPVSVEQYLAILRPIVARLPDR